MKLIKNTKCDECGKRIKNGILFEHCRRTNDIFVLCVECANKGRALLYEAAPNGGVMEILQDLYDSEINFRLSCFWDGGFDVEIGDPINGFRAQGSGDTIAEAVEWLKRKVFDLYPNSDFSRKYRRVLTADREGTTAAR